MNPTVGWISGFDLSTNSSAKVYDGVTGESYGDKAVALHICLPDHKIASLGIVNIFDVDDNDIKIEFEEDALSVTKCLVNGKEVLFSDYISENKIDTQLPLVADYNSVLINVSIKSISEESKTVDFYAPVFSGKEYRFARPVSNYAASFAEHLQEHKGTKPIFSCNCILNYLYGELEGKATPPLLAGYFRRSCISIIKPNVGVCRDYRQMIRISALILPQGTSIKTSGSYLKE